jgi:hypothetical protein
LAHPSEFVENAKVVADSLQAAMDFLKDITCDNPRHHFGIRVVIGYTRKAGQPNWSGCKGNRIELPWPKHPNKAKEGLSALSHELVHPFFRVSALHDKNEFWGEGFCDFLRGPVMYIMDLDGKEWWKQKIEQAQMNKQDRGGNVAGQLVLMAWEEHGDTHDIDQFIGWFIDDRATIRVFVRSLYNRFSDRSMAEEFKPTEWIRAKMQDLQEKTCGSH